MKDAAVVVVLTRAAADNAELEALARAHGAEVRALACLRTEPAGELAAQRQALANLDRTLALVFAARPAVHAFARLYRDFLPPPGPSTEAVTEATSAATFAALPPCYAVGPGTAAAVRTVLGREARVPAVHTGAGLLALVNADFAARPARLLLPAAAEGRLELTHGLQARGHEVVRLPVYRTAPSPARLPQVTWDARVHYIVVTSPSCVVGFFAQAQLPARAVFVSIGPTTTAALRGLGVPCAGVRVLEAASHDAQGLHTALKQLLESP